MAALKTVVCALLLVNIQLGFVACNDIEAIAEKAYEAVNQAAKSNLISQEHAEEVNAGVAQAAERNELAQLQEVDIALNSAVNEQKLTTNQKVACLINAINEGLYKIKGASLSDAVAATLESAARLDIVSAETAEAAKEAAPKSVKPDINATTSAEDVRKVAEPTY